MQQSNTGDILWSRQSNDDKFPDSKDETVNIIARTCIEKRSKKARDSSKKTTKNSKSHEKI